MALGAHKEQAERLTLEAVIEDPLLLLNADEEELREFFERRARELRDTRPTFIAVVIERSGDELAAKRAGDREVREAAAQAVELVQAFREAFRAADSAERDAEALITTTKRLSDAWAALRPQTTDRLVLATEDGELFAGTPDQEEVELRWQVVPLAGMRRRLGWEALVDDRGMNAWLRLMALLEATTPGKAALVLVCPVCGRVQRRSRSDQIYCSTACAKRAYDLRTGRGRASER